MSWPQALEWALAETWQMFWWLLVLDAVILITLIAIRPRRHTKYKLKR